MLTPEERARAEEEARLHAQAAEDLKATRQLQGCGCVLAAAVIGGLGLAFPPLLVILVPLAIYLAMKRRAA